MVRLFCIFVVTIFVKIFYRHKVYGKENLPRGGGLIAANHCSFLDPPLLGISYPGEIHFLAKESLFNSSSFAWLLRKLNTHPVASGKGNLSTFKKALEFIENGYKVVIFPEGQRSLSGELLPGQAGIGMLVLKSGSPVIPVYIHGTYAIWSAQGSKPKMKGRTACVFGAPLYFEHLKTLDKKTAHQQIADEIMIKIAELKVWYLNGAKGTPP